MTGPDAITPGPRRPGQRRRYHHGDLRAALIETTIELLGEHGIQAFSMAEASRRLGVAGAAPYRHFADRDALLAAVAVRAAELLGQRLADEAAAGSPPQRLAAAARAYVRFASDQRPLFQALVGSGLDKSQHPEIGHAAQAIAAAFLSPAASLVNGNETAAARLTSAIVATAHGHAVLMLDGTFGAGHHAAETAAQQAAAATLALIAGHESLTGPGPGPAPVQR
jgi:AcrR family transcriptional regulator